MPPHEASRVPLRVRALRHQHGWTQPELAERAGLSNSAVGAIERGKRNPKPWTLDRLAAAFGVSVEEILQGSAPPARDPALAVQEPTPPLFEGEARFDPALTTLLAVLHGQPDVVIRTVTEVARVVATEFNRSKRRGRPPKRA